MKTARIYGTIVHHGDLPDLLEQDMQKRGMITTDADFASQMATVGDDDLTVLINSYGGDTVAASMMGIQIDRWAMEHPRRKVIYEVEALAASAAANLVALALPRVRVVAHPSSMIMYHGCAGMAVGGEGAMTDAAKKMRNYNSAVKESLIAKTNLPENEVDEWFEEGREGWLTGYQALACGLAHEIYGEDVRELPAMAKVEAANPVITKLAACAAQIKEKVMGKMNAECGSPKKPKAEGEQTPKDREDERLAERIHELEVENASLKEENAKLKGEGEQTPKDREDEKLGEEVRELKREVAELKKKNAALTAGFRTPSTPTGSGKNFAELVRDIPKGLSAKAYCEAFEKLKAEHKSEYDKYMAAHQSR